MIVELNAKNFDKQTIGMQMKAAQQYMVNLFSYELRKLSTLGAIWQTESGVIVLREEYYNDAFGVQVEEKSNTYCMI